MKKYLSFFRIRFIQGLQYRTAAYAGILTQFLWGIMEILLFLTFYHSDPEAFPMGFSQLTSYYWLQQAFLALFMTWLMEEEIFSSISNGTVAYELCKPLDLYSMWFAKSMANRSAKAVLRCMPILLIAFLLPTPYSLTLPADWNTTALFLLSMILGFLVVVAFSMLIYISTFFTLSPLGIRVVALSLVEFLSGGIIPLPFLPDRLRHILELLPFASMQNAPYRIYSGNISGSETITALALQFFWLIALIAIGRFFMSSALKRAVIQGG